MYLPFLLHETPYLEVNFASILPVSSGGQMGHLSTRSKPASVCSLILQTLWSKFVFSFAEVTFLFPRWLGTRQQLLCRRHELTHLLGTQETVTRADGVQGPWSAGPAPGPPAAAFSDCAQWPLENIPCMNWGRSFGSLSPSVGEQTAQTSFLLNSKENISSLGKLVGA